MASGYTVEGLNKVVRGLVDLGVEVDDLKDAFAEIAAEAAQKASQFAPKKTGALAATIRGNKAKNKAVVTAGRAKVKYAGAINYGWPKRGIKPSGFMQKTDEAMRPDALAKLEEAINKIINEKGLD